MIPYDLAQEREWFPKIRGMSDEDAVIWLDNLYCDACEGCPDCEHRCHLSDEQRAANEAYADEIRRDAFTRKDGEVWQNSRGRWMKCTVTTNRSGGPCTNITYADDRDIPP